MKTRLFSCALLFLLSAMWAKGQTKFSLSDKNGANILFNQHVESELVFGKGRAYGVELFLKKKTGRLTGWISYTLSRTERQFDAINFGKYFPARQDRTHDIAVVGSYELTPKWSLSTNWIYYTGNAVTNPTGSYEIEGKIIPLYTTRNQSRMPNYHRLDLGAVRTISKDAKHEKSLAFSLYNALATRMPT